MDLNKNVVVFQNKFYILFIDIEDGKQIYLFKWKEEEEIKNIILLDNKYLIFHTKIII